MGLMSMSQQVRRARPLVSSAVGSEFPSSPSSSVLFANFPHLSSTAYRRVAFTSATRLSSIAVTGPAPSDRSIGQDFQVPHGLQVGTSNRLMWDPETLALVVGVASLAASIVAVCLARDMVQSQLCRTQTNCSEGCTRGDCMLPGLCCDWECDEGGSIVPDWTP